MRSTGYGGQEWMHLNAADDLGYGKQAVVECAGKDRYWCVLGRVVCDGVDANPA